MVRCDFLKMQLRTEEYPMAALRLHPVKAGGLIRGFRRNSFGSLPATAPNRARQPPKANNQTTRYDRTPNLASHQCHRSNHGVCSGPLKANRRLDRIKATAAGMLVATFL